MKAFWLLSLISLSLFSVSHAVAERVTVPTKYTCQQDDGDQWIEAGLALNDGPGLRLLVVSHNEDDGSAKLIADRVVYETRVSESLLYEDAFQTIRLMVSKATTGSKGDLSVLMNGPGSFVIEDLICIERSEISYDQ